MACEAPPCSSDASRGLCAFRAWFLGFFFFTRRVIRNLARARSASAADPVAVGSICPMLANLECYVEKC
ncbi:hypothetical protein V8C40DRAFT_29144 [Trichoderma camerunense]